MNKKNVRDILTREGIGRVGVKPYKTALYEQFDILPAATQAAGKSYMWDLTGAGTPAVAFATDGGGLKLTTTNADNDSTFLWSLASGAWSVPRKPDGTRQHRFASTVATDATVASTAILWGLKLTDTAATVSPYKTDADQILFVYDTDGIDIDPATGYADVSANPTTWYIVVSIGGTDYTINTGVTVAASTEYEFAIEIGTDKRAQCFINGNQVNLSALPVLTSTASLLPVFGCYARTTTAVNASIRNLRYQGA